MILNSDFSVNEEFAFRKRISKFAGYDADLSCLNNNVWHDFSLPPDRTIEVSSRPTKVFQNADFTFYGPVPRLACLS
jgi:hypothetical protein